MINIYLAYFYQWSHTLTIFAAAKKTKCEAGGFLEFPHWWKYVKDVKPDVAGGCNVNIEVPNGLFSIIFAIIDMLLYAAGLIAVIMIIYAGIQYLTSAGNPDRTASAQKRIINTLLGLAIVIVSTAVVNFIGRKLS